MDSSLISPEHPFLFLVMPPLQTGSKSIPQVAISPCIPPLGQPVFCFVSALCLRVSFGPEAPKKRFSAPLTPGIESSEFNGQMIVAAFARYVGAHTFLWQHEDIFI